MAIFDFLKARPQSRKATDAPKSPHGRVMLAWDRPTIKYNEHLLASAAVKHPVVFRVLNKIATAVQTVEWYAEPDFTEPASRQASASVIRALNDVLSSPNDWLTATQLRYWMAMNYALYARIPIKLGVSATERKVNGIYPLEARYVKVKTNDRGIPTEYKYGTTSNEETIPAKKLVYDAITEQFKSAFAYEIARPTLAGTFNHADEKSNLTALSTLGLPAQIVNLLLQRAADSASGVPNTRYIVSADKNLTDKQREALTEHAEGMETDEDDSGHVLFLYNTSVEVHPLDNDLTDIHTKVPLDDMSRMIAGAFGVPIALLGLAAGDSAKFAGNYIESRRSFYEDTIIPEYLTPIAGGLTASICPPGAVIKFDLDSIPALADARVLRSKELKDVKFLTDDEKRELCGFPPKDSSTRAQRRRKNMSEDTKGA